YCTLSESLIDKRCGSLPFIRTDRFQGPMGFKPIQGGRRNCHVPPPAFAPSAWEASLAILPFGRYTERSSIKVPLGQLRASFSTLTRTSSSCGSTSLISTPKSCTSELFLR